jgi:protein-S-isoprenylcysteine O-methyltransferase Ste14
MMFVRVLPLALFVAVVLMLAAGRLDVPAFWAYPSLLWLLSGGVYTFVQRRDPALVRERMKPPSDRDRTTRRVVVPLAVLHYAIAGLAVGRFGHTVPAWVQVLGFALVAAGLLLTGWTLVANPFASSAVRIQGERGQTVIDTGPYAIVRHPMYLSVLLFCLGSGPALGSWWSSLALVPVLAVFVRRTRLEDRMLHDELPGYAAYARRVRSRVLPGIF